MLDIPVCAKLGEGTLCTLGRAGGADVSAKQNDAMAKIAAFLRRQDGPQLLLHLLRVFSLGKTQSAADADAVGVADDAARHAV